MARKKALSAPKAAKKPTSTKMQQMTKTAVKQPTRAALTKPTVNVDRSGSKTATRQRSINFTDISSTPKPPKRRTVVGKTQGARRS
jgi:hypothetical protein